MGGGRVGCREWVGREQGFVKLIKAVSQSLKLKVHFKGCVYSISMQQVNNTFKRGFSKKF